MNRVINRASVSRLGVFIFTLALLGLNQTYANPWLLPPGTFVMSGRYDYSYANQEYLADNGELTAYSLNGEYQASSYTLAARLGLSEKFELELSLPLKSVSYEADPLILLPTESVGLDAFDFYQENIINFNQTLMGFGDLQVASRYRLSVYPIASSVEFKLTAPTGYRMPEGTFGTSPKTIDAFISQVGQLVDPTKIRDDVTLGDGVFSFQPALHLGYGTSGGFFARTSVGVQLRNQGAGDLFNAEFKLGQMANSWLLLYGGVYLERTLTEGRIIGVSVASVDASLPAKEYAGLDNLKPILVSLDRDLLVAPVGLLVRPLSNVDFTLSYSPVIWGRNVSKSHTVSLGVNVTSELL